MRERCGLQSFTFARTIHFVFFDAEEVGLKGANNYVLSMSRQKRSIHTALVGCAAPAVYSTRRVAPAYFYCRQTLTNRSGLQIFDMLGYIESKAKSQSKWTSGVLIEYGVTQSTSKQRSAQVCCTSTAIAAVQGRAQLTCWNACCLQWDLVNVAIDEYNQYAKAGSNGYTIQQ